MEWCLGYAALDRLLSAWGQPMIDLFETAVNGMVPIIISPYPNERALGVDALSHDWDNFQLAHVFPPLTTVPKVLDKI